MRKNSNSLKCHLTCSLGLSATTDMVCAGRAPENRSRISGFEDRGWEPRSRPMAIFRKRGLRFSFFFGRILQWQKLWESKIGYMMSNYEEQWPMMVYIQKYLGKRRRQQRKAARQRDRERGEAGMPEVDHAYTDTKRGSSSPVCLIFHFNTNHVVRHSDICALQASDGTGGLSSFDTKPAIQPVSHAFLQTRHHISHRTSGASLKEVFSTAVASRKAKRMRHRTKGIQLGLHNRQACMMKAISLLSHDDCSRTEHCQEIASTLDTRCRELISRYLCVFI